MIKSLDKYKNWYINIKTECLNLPNKTITKVYGPFRGVTQNEAEKLALSESTKRMPVRKTRQIAGAHFYWNTSKLKEHVANNPHFFVMMMMEDLTDMKATDKNGIFSVVSCVKVDYDFSTADEQTQKRIWSLMFGPDGIIEETAICHKFGDPHKGSCFVDSKYTDLILAILRIELKDTTEEQ